MLSNDCVKKMLVGENFANPILKIKQLDKMLNNNQDTIVRFRVALGDQCDQSILAILSAKHNHLVETNQVKIDSVLRLDDYRLNVLSIDPPRAVLDILNFHVLLDETGRELFSDLSPIKKFKSNPVTAYSVNKTPIAIEQTMFNGCKIVPIANLNPFQNKWSIKVRCSMVREIKHLTEKNLNFQVAEFTDSSGQIKLTEFVNNVNACGKLKGILKDNIYYISNCLVKNVNKKYCSLNNKYEMSITRSSVVQLCQDASAKFYVSLDQVFEKKINDLIDVIGIIKSVQATSSTFSKAAGKIIVKRDFCIFDAKTCSMAVTIWNEQANEFKGIVDQIITIKNAKICDFNGIRLNVNDIENIDINPDIPESHNLRHWFNQTRDVSQSTIPSMDTSSKNENNFHHETDPITKRNNETKNKV